MRLIFSHIPKTAGTSVRNFVQDQMERTPAGCRKVFAVVGRPGDDRILQRDFPTHPLREDWNFLAGHVTLEAFLQHPGVSRSDSGIMFFSFVRDPIDRLVSLVNFTYVNAGHSQHQKAAQHSPVDYLLHVSKRQANLQSTYLRLSGDMPSWRFRIATVRNIDETCAEAIGWVAGVPPPRLGVPRANVTSRRAMKFPGHALLTKEALSRETLRTLQEENALDIALYEEVATAGVLHHLPGTVRREAP